MNDYLVIFTFSSQKSPTFKPVWSHITWRCYRSTKVWVVK